ncbi:hypothetical protein KW787_02660 [Candidatus Pacearchaeota archaeon]|nr:hypothetical protein [Candidatus Pacearchaeota archaeon]
METLASFWEYMDKLRELQKNSLEVMCHHLGVSPVVPPYNLEASDCGIHAGGIKINPHKMFINMNPFWNEDSYYDPPITIEQRKLDMEYTCLHESGHILHFNINEKERLLSVESHRRRINKLDELPDEENRNYLCEIIADFYPYLFYEVTEGLQFLSNLERRDQLWKFPKGKRLKRHYWSAGEKLMFSIYKKIPSLDRKISLYNELLKVDHNDAPSLPYINLWFKAQEEAGKRMEARDKKRNEKNGTF